MTALSKYLLYLKTGEALLGQGGFSHTQRLGKAAQATCFRPYMGLSATDLMMNEAIDLGCPFSQFFSQNDRDNGKTGG